MKVLIVGYTKRDAYDEKHTINKIRRKQHAKDKKMSLS